MCHIRNSMPYGTCWSPSAPTHSSSLLVMLRDPGTAARGLIRVPIRDPAYYMALEERPELHPRIAYWPIDTFEFGIVYVEFVNDPITVMDKDD